ncbi:MAG TPA: type II secretion system protein GspM [Gammaproteobacteria bacterium]
MKEWFMQRKPRERLLFGGGAAAAALIVFWGLVWTPMRNGSVELRDAVEEKTQALVDLRRAAALQAVPTGNRPAGASAESLVVLVDSTAQVLGLAGAFTRTRPDGADAISVSFQNAAFDALLEWFVTLEQSHGVSVESASFNGARDQGRVSGQVFLRRS